jgi:hypothetical protein
VTLAGLALGALAMTACDNPGDEDRLDPGGESIIDEDDNTVITDPGGVVNDLDGEDGDVEDIGDDNINEDD